MHRIIRRFLGGALNTTSEHMQAVEDTVESNVASVRKSFYRRFPVLFTFMVAFGVVITFLGFEQIVLQISLFHDNPVFMIVVGVTILVLTGKLLKKLR